MTAGTPTLTSESTSLKSTRQGARGPGAVVHWPHCAIWNFFFFQFVYTNPSESQLYSRQADMPAPETCKCKGEPPASVSTTAVMSGWMTVGACSRVDSKSGQGYS